MHSSMTMCTCPASMSSKDSYTRTMFGWSRDLCMPISLSSSARTCGVSSPVVMVLRA